MRRRHSCEGEGMMFSIDEQNALFVKRGRFFGRLKKEKT